MQQISSANNDTLVQHYFQQYERARAAQDDTPLWLLQLRQQAITAWQQVGVPSMREEAWKYSKLHGLQQQRFTPTTALTSAPVAITKLLPTFDAYNLIFVDGHYCAPLSTAVMASDLQITHLANMLQSERANLKDYLAQHQHIFNHGFALLNTALFQDGAYIYLPENTILAKPIHLIFITTANAANTVSHLRHVVIAGENSNATIIESYISEHASAYLTNTVMEMHVAANASITHCYMQDESKQATHLRSCVSYQQRAASTQFHSYTFGSSFSRNDIYVQLSAEHSNTALYGMYLANGKQHMEQHTVALHEKPHTVSHENYKGVLSDHGHGVFSGCVKVHAGANKTIAKQQNSNLILSENAEVDTKPQLEIFADDVQCNHGATVGELAHEALFYLRSRGIPALHAKRLLLEGFANELVQLMKNEAMRKWVQAKMIEKLNAMLIVE